MTRDEAIKELKEYEDGLDLEYATPFDKAILYAIKALDQEPQTFKWCTDCKEYDQEKHCCHRWSKVIRDTVEEMKQEQEPKTGHWIRITNGAMKEKYICSECGRQIEDYGIESLLPIKYPYCHCGAKMIEPQESEVKG